jgi:hypothetical protein
MNTETVPNSTNETQVLDQTEKEYDRMISQQMMYHRVMMEDLMKLSTEKGSTIDDRMNAVAGLGNTMLAIDASNRNLLQSAQGITNQGSQNATTASNLHANIKETSASLANDVSQYAALMQQMQKEGFSNPTMDAALENSAIMSESEKYALVLFGVCAIFLIYKTVKYL